MINHVIDSSSPENNPQRAHGEIEPSRYPEVYRDVEAHIPDT